MRLPSLPLLRPGSTAGVYGIALVVLGLSSLALERAATAPAGLPAEHCEPVHVDSQDPLERGPFCAYGLEPTSPLDWSAVRCVGERCTVPPSLIADFMRGPNVVTAGACLIPEYVHCEHDVPGLLLLFPIGPPARSLHAALGLQVGDIVRTIDGVPARTLRDAFAAVGRLRDGKPVVLGIERQRRTLSRQLLLDTRD